MFTRKVCLSPKLYNVNCSYFPFDKQHLEVQTGGYTLKQAGCRMICVYLIDDLHLNLKMLTLGIKHS